MTKDKENYYKCFIPNTTIDFVGIDAYAPKWAKKLRVYLTNNGYKFTFLK